MKNKSYIKLLLLILLFPPILSCTKMLDETVYSELSDDYLKTESGLNTVLYSAYSNIDYVALDVAYKFTFPLFSAGVAYGQGGSFEAEAVRFKAFTWDSNTAYFSGNWNKCYLAIRDANILLDMLNSGEGNYSENYKKSVAAQAKAIRGYAYSILNSLFGPTPIYTTAKNTDYNKPRATSAEMLNQIETDLTEAAADLPVVQDLYGKMTKGAALGVLCKHYLYTKQWQKSADAAQKIVDLNTYSLRPNYADIFGVANERNSELIMVNTADPINKIEYLLGITLPNDYPLLPTQLTFAARVYFNDAFVNSFDDNDTRKGTFVKSYVNTTGKTIVGYGSNKTLSLKYKPDPNAVGVNSGIDLPEIRYADILMDKAEALNEINGPNQTTIDLVNQIRLRAGISSLSLGSYTKETLRTQILQERSKEFYFEGKEREDLLRHGKFISNAISVNGANAKEYHVLFPLPQAELDANSNINENNPGY